MVAIGISLIISVPSLAVVVIVCFPSNLPLLFVTFRSSITLSPFLSSLLLEKEEL